MVRFAAAGVSCLLVLVLTTGLQEYAAQEGASFDVGLRAFKEQKYLEAIECWTPLASKGDVRAQHALARMYSLGIGVEKRDPIAALKWTRAAAEQGYLPACFDLGHSLLLGDGTEKDVASGIEWLTIAARGSHAEAQLVLGELYLEGPDVVQDCQRAAKWIRRAAEHGLREAETALGVMLLRGTCVTRDDREAAQWLRRAAEKGHIPAQKQLAELYWEGLGVPKDKVKAYMWMCVVFPEGHFVDMEFPSLSPEEIEKAEEMASEWVRAHPYTADELGLLGIE